MSKRRLVLLGVMFISVAELLAAAPEHPFDHLTAAEHWTTEHDTEAAKVKAVITCVQDAGIEPVLHVSLTR